MKDGKLLITGIIFELFLLAFVVLFLKIDNFLLSLLLIAVAIGFYLLLSVKTSVVENLTKALTFKKRELMISGLILVIALPFFFLSNIYIIHILILALIYAIAAVGLDFQMGSTGMVNFAQGTMLGIGAYTSALLCTTFGVSFWVGLLGGMIVSGIFGIILGLPTLKTKEYHLSLVTIAFAYVGYLLILNMKWTGGPDGIAGIPKPKIFGFNLSNSISIGSITIPGKMIYFYLVLLILVLLIVVASRFRNSWLGLSWNAIRDDEISAKCYGIPLMPYKLLSFIFGSIFAGVAGVLYAHLVGFISTESMAFSVDLLLVAMVILGGMDSIVGVIIGAILLVIIPEKFRSIQDFRILLYAATLILMLVFRPQGLIPKRVRIYRNITGGR